MDGIFTFTDPVVQKDSWVEQLNSCLCLSYGVVVCPVKCTGFSYALCLLPAD